MWCAWLLGQLAGTSKYSTYCKSKSKRWCSRWWRAILNTGKTETKTSFELQWHFLICPVEDGHGNSVNSTRTVQLFFLQAIHDDDPARRNFWEALLESHLKQETAWHQPPTGYAYFLYLSNIKKREAITYLTVRHIVPLVAENRQRFEYDNWQLLVCTETILRRWRPPCVWSSESVSQSGLIMHQVLRPATS